VATRLQGPNQLNFLISGVPEQRSEQGRMLPIGERPPALNPTRPARLMAVDLPGKVGVHRHTPLFKEVWRDVLLILVLTHPLF
jgi:hypothetical protein